MGLDMYLLKKTFVGAKYEHRNVKGKIDIEVNGEKLPIDFSRVSEIVEEVGYWRKANHIHRWFVENVQDGDDDCGEYYVSYEKLLELRAICEEALKNRNRAEQILPRCEGFFFGSQEIDEDYFEDIRETIKIIDSLDPDGEYYYTSSW